VPVQRGEIGPTSFEPANLLLIPYDHQLLSNILAIKSCHTAWRSRFVGLLQSFFFLNKANVVKRPGGRRLDYESQSQGFRASANIRCLAVWRNGRCRHELARKC